MRKQKLCRILSGILATALALCVPLSQSASALDASGIQIVYDLQVASLANGVAMTSTNATYAETNGFWAMDATYGTVTVQRNTINGTQVLPNANAWWSMRVQIPKTGSYALELSSYTKTTNAGLITAYFGPAASGASAIAGGTAVGSIDTYASSTSRDNSASFGTVEVTAAGEYIIVLKAANSPQTGNTRRQYIKTITLNGGDSLAVIGQGALTSDSIAVDGTATLSLDKAYTSDGADITASVQKGSFSSSDTDVATVDPVTGVVTGISEGTAKISLPLTSGTYTGTLSRSISVLDPTRSGVTAKYSFKGAVPSGSHVFDMTYADTNGAWQFESVYRINEAELVSRLRTNSVYGIQAQPNMLGSSWSLRLAIPKTGKYTAELEYYARPQNGIADVYLAPASVHSSLRTSEEYKLGTVNFYAETATAGLKQNFGDKTLTEKEYILTFVTAEYGNEAGETKQQTPTALTLNGGTGNIYSFATLGIDKKELTVGETAQLSTVACYNGNAVAEADTGTAGSYVSTDTKVATVTAEGVVTAVGVGRAFIDTVVTLGDDTQTARCMVSVIDAAGTSTGKLSVATTGGTIADVNELGVTVGGDTTLAVGTWVTLTAEETEGKTFSHWLNTMTRRVMSADATITFAVGSETAVTAVYNSEDDARGTRVAFYDKNGRILSIGYLNADNTSVPVPANPYSEGYVFAHWSRQLVGDSALLGTAITASDIIGNTNFFANYTPESATYSISIDGNPITKSFNEQVTATAELSSGGKQFAYWTRDGKIVSYSPNYSFYVWGNTQLTSVYADDAPRAVPVIVLAEAKPSVGKVAFMAERSVPDDRTATIVETGIIISAGETVPTLDAHTTKSVSQSSSGNGQFSVYADELASGEACTARGYIIYIDNDKTARIVYSNAVTAQAN